MKNLVAFVSGLIFGVGLLISGMANPAKVLNFFDVFGHWDPSLAFVMAGALGTNLLGYRLARRNSTPWMDARFYVPSRADLDPVLLLGAAMFGVGWGISGFCPGASFPALGLGQAAPIYFFIAMLTGMILARYTRSMLSRSPNVA